jgi:hypothetical protein
METSGSDLLMIVDVVLPTKRQLTLDICPSCWFFVLGSTVNISGFFIIIHIHGYAIKTSHLLECPRTADNGVGILSAIFSSNFHIVQ